MKRLHLLAILAVLVAIANAAVFVYYPLDVNIQGTKAEVRFALGGNANQPDLAGQTITVTLEGSYKTKATITVHPTNERTYYRNVLVIQNTGGHTYYGWINVKTPIDDENIISAKMYIKSGGTTIATIDLMSKTIQPNDANIPIYEYSNLNIDIEIEISRVVDASSVSDSAELELIYSPQYEESP